MVKYVVVFLRETGSGQMVLLTILAKNSSLVHEYSLRVQILRLFSNLHQRFSLCLVDS